MDTITIDDFQKVDIRIGTVVEATVPEWSHWVMKLSVDFGPAFAESTGGKQYRTIFSGIMKFYQPEEIIGKQFPFVINLEPKKIGPDRELSEGMLMAVDTSKSETDEDSKPILFTLLEPAPNGSKVV